LSRAVELRSPASGGLTYDEIVDAARQAGIPADAIEAAATEVETKRPVAREDDLVRDEVAARTWKARRNFALHFTAYVMIMALLAFANMQTWHDGDHTLWWVYPALGWGVLIGTHFTSVLYAYVFPDPRRDERVRLELRAREERLRRREKKEKKLLQTKEELGELKESAKELGVAVQRGMAVLLSDVARSIHQEVDRASRAPGGKPGVRVETKARVGEGDDGEDERDEGDERRAGRRR
jgi:hypothetical protein